MSDNKFNPMRLMAKNRAVVLASVIALAVAAAYLALFAPLFKELGLKFIECRSRENSVAEARNLIEACSRLDKTCGGRVLLSEKDAASGIDEFAKHGKLLGVNFIFIKPRDVLAKEGMPYKILPVNMELEANDAQLVKFMGSIDELKKAIVKVKNFDISPTKDDHRVLNMKMTIELYLSAKD